MSRDLYVWMPVLALIFGGLGSVTMCVGLLARSARLKLKALIQDLIWPPWGRP